MDECVDFSGSGVVSKCIKSNSFLVPTGQVGETMRHIMCKDTILLIFGDVLFLVVLFVASYGVIDVTVSLYRLAR